VRDRGADRVDGRVIGVLDHAAAAAPRRRHPPHGLAGAPDRAERVDGDDAANVLVRRVRDR